MTRDDWTDLSLKLLGEQGPEALTVDAVCDAAGRTRGSLYHHFNDMEALLAGILERWRVLHTEHLIEVLESATPHAEGQPYRLNSLAFALDYGIERNVRRLIARRPALRHFVAEVDTRRTEYVSELMQRGVGVDPVQAELLAHVVYAAWIGFQHLEPEPDQARLALLYQSFAQIVQESLSKHG
ncbi:TetR/AcrR family transcriptional regulator [bacterium]|nr:TetR/AcrR family transcriptional regulator [bacterium]